MVSGTSTHARSLLLMKSCVSVKAGLTVRKPGPRVFPPSSKPQVDSRITGIPDLSRYMAHQRRLFLFRPCLVDSNLREL